MLTVTEHGVIPDGKTLNTEAIQKLIDKCGEAGGGTLIFPPGRYLTGGLELRSNLTLHLENGATLLGSTNLSDYKLYNPSPVRFHEDKEGLRALLFAHKVNNIRLCGTGTIDGQGPLINRAQGVRASMPRNIWFGECEDVSVEGLHLRHAGFWMQHYMKCTRLRLQGLDVYNHGSCNNDGCDIDCCRDVIVSDCNIDSHDDALCLKSGNDCPTENVVITNCITRTHCNHFKTGTESNGGFRNITVSNLQMVPSTVLESDPNTGGADWRGACGIALGCVDGGMMENISVSHVQMDQVRVPFFIKFGDRGRLIHEGDIHRPVQFARGIRLSHITAKQASSTGCYIMGLPEQAVRDVRIEHCDFEFEGGGDDALAESTVPLRREVYPSCDAFGSLPSLAIFMRDAEDIQLSDLNLRTMNPDTRPALRWQRVRNLELDGIRESK
jgi:polygalacturonase